MGFLCMMHSFRVFLKNSKFWCLLKTLHRSQFSTKSIANFAFGSLLVPSKFFVVYISNIESVSENFLKIYFLKISKKKWKKSTDGAQNFRIDKNKNKKLSETK